jgi:putative peptidoglycan lipid II flippase
MVVIWALGNLLSLVILPAQWVVVGVGASMSIANASGAALSYYLLHRRFGQLDGNRVLGAHLKMLAAAAVGGLAAFLISQGVHAVLGAGRVSSMAAAMLGGVTLIALYVLVLRRLKVTELDDALVPLLRRR